MNHPYSKGPVFIFFLCLYALSLGRGFYSSDGEVMFKTTAALVGQNTFALEADSGLPQIVPGQNGQFYSKYDPGLPLLAVPFYAAGDWLAAINAAHRYRVAAIVVLLLPVTAAALALAGLARIDLPHPITPSGGQGALDRTPALIMVLAAGLGTPLWVYARTLFAETILAAALTWAVVLIWDQDRSVRASRFLFAGIVFGLGILTRAAFAVYLPALVWLVLRAQRERPLRDHMLRLAVFGAGIAPFAAALLWHNALRFGAALRFGYTGEGFTTPLWEGVIGLLASPDKSVFLYAPPLILSVLHWPRFRRAYPALGECLLLAWGGALLFYGGWWAWHGGWCWGPRFLVPLLPLSCLPLIMLRWGRGLVWALIVAGCAVQLLGLLVDITPHYAARITPDGTTDYTALHTDPRESAVVYAAERVSVGDTEPLALFHLDDTGLPPFWTRGVPALWCMGLLWSGWRLGQPARSKTQ